MLFTIFNMTTKVQRNIVNIGFIHSEVFFAINPSKLLKTNILSLELYGTQNN